MLCLLYTNGVKFTVNQRARLDRVLAEQQVTVSRVKAGALIRRGCVLLNGRIIRKPAHLVQPGDSVSMNDSEEQETESHIAPADLKLTVLYEDKSCLVLDKPAGIAVHPAPGLSKDEPTILHGIAFLFKKMKIPFSASSILAHRLDRETTGCLLIAKSPQAHTALQKQFKDRTIQKTYLAVVAGVPAQSEAHIDAPIGRSVSNRTKMSVLGSTAARSAQTTYHVLAASAEAALLACDLHTGRTHQIRVHLSAIGHPILGDETYTSPESEALSQKRKIHSLSLHAWKLSFHSPVKKVAQSITAPLPATLQNSLKTLSLPCPPNS